MVNFLLVLEISNQKTFCLKTTKISARSRSVISVQLQHGIQMIKSLSEKRWALSFTWLLRSSQDTMMRSATFGLVESFSTSCFQVGIPLRLTMRQSWDRSSLKVSSIWSPPFGHPTLMKLRIFSEGCLMWSQIKDLGLKTQLTINGSKSMMITSFPRNLSSKVPWKISWTSKQVLSRRSQCTTSSLRNSQQRMSLTWSQVSSKTWTEMATESWDSRKQWAHSKRST